MAENYTNIQIESKAEDILRQLKEMGYRITGSRRITLTHILRQQGHFTAQQIIDQIDCEDNSIGRSTIFRTFDLLVELGFVQKIYLGSGGHGYVVCGRSHHHHLVCSDCGTIIDFSESLIENTLHKIASQHHFKVGSHALEIYGLCKACQQKSN